MYGLLTPSLRNESKHLALRANNMIHPDTRLGAVHLTIRDLRRSLDFYQQRLGFQLRHLEGSKANLGAGGQDLLVLYENPDASPYPNRSGLYHFAILVPSRLELAQSLRHIAETETQVQGFADHLVSEAIYLPDPDGNGIEIYRDRPRENWQSLDGELKMATDPLNIESVLDELHGQEEPWPGLDPSTKMGHMHLHVSAIEAAENFYHDVLGFDKMMRYGPSASFLSAGGYHHHLGLNTWNGAGAPPPPPDAVGLRWFVIQLPNENELNRVIDRVQTAGLAIHEHGTGWLVRDPASNGVLLTSM